MKQIQQIANIVNSDYRVAVIESGRRDTIVDLFEQYGDYYNQGVYIWEKGIGLQRLGLDGINIPDTRSLKNAFTFIASSVHFGIYLIKDFPERRSHRVNVMLREIAKSKKTSPCFVSLLGQKITIEKRIEPYVLTVQCGMETNTQRPHGLAPQQSVVPHSASSF